MKTFWYKLVESMDSVRWYAVTVWRHRWWDYSYQLTMIDRMLGDCERYWGKTTHHEGDTFTLGRIRVVRRYLKEYEEEVCCIEEDRKLKKFLKAYARLLPRLWD